MTQSQLKSILSQAGITSYKDIQIPNLNTIIMSQNFYVVPGRDYFTIEDNLVKIKQRCKNNKGEIVDISTHTNDIYFDVANIVGLEFLNPRSRY